MLESLLIFMVLIIFISTVVAFLFGIIGVFGLFASRNIEGLKIPLSIILASSAFIYVNLKFVGVGNENSFIKSYSKEEVSNTFKKATINEVDYLVSDDISLKIDDLKRTFKILSDLV